MIRAVAHECAFPNLQPLLFLEEPRHHAVGVLIGCEVITPNGVFPIANQRQARIRGAAVEGMVMSLIYVERQAL